MKRTQSKRFLFVGTFVLLVVVGLLSFGERARHGHYHFDGGRGWDFAPAAPLEVVHANLRAVTLSPAKITVDQQETLFHIPVLQRAIPAARSVALGAWQRLRPPPHV